MKQRSLGKRRQSKIKLQFKSSQKCKINGWDTGSRAMPLDVHPGELLRDEFMKPLRLSPEAIGKALPRHPKFCRLDFVELVRDFIRADAEAFIDLIPSLALDRYFGMSDGFFWRLQAAYEVRDCLPANREWLSGIKLDQ